MAPAKIERPAETDLSAAGAELVRQMGRAWSLAALPPEGGRASPVTA